MTQVQQMDDLDDSAFRVCIDCGYVVDAARCQCEELAEADRQYTEWKDTVGR